MLYTNYSQMIMEVRRNNIKIASMVGYQCNSLHNNKIISDIGRNLYFNGINLSEVFNYYVKEEKKLLIETINKLNKIYTLNQTINKDLNAMDLYSVIKDLLKEIYNSCTEKKFKARKASEVLI